MTFFVIYFFTFSYCLFWLQKRLVTAMTQSIGQKAHSFTLNCVLSIYFVTTDKCWLLFSSLFDICYRVASHSWTLPQIASSIWLINVTKSLLINTIVLLLCTIIIVYYLFVSYFNKTLKLICWRDNGKLETNVPIIIYLSISFIKLLISKFMK